MEKQKEYYAFISYKREDEKWAKWLQNKLEHYRFPTNLNGHADLPKNIRPTFRDVTDLTPGLLAEKIDNALRSSEWLIVICSPRSAKSPWVCKEAQTFIDLERADKIIPFVIEGSPFSNNNITECYPKALLNLNDDKELLGANINELGRNAAVIKVVARMFNLRFDALWQRFERERKKRRMITLLSLLLTTILGFIVAGNMFLQYRKIQLTLSRAITYRANQLIEQGDSYLARKLLLEILPNEKDIIERPYDAEAEATFRLACEHNSNVFWNKHSVSSVSISPNGEHIVSASRNLIYIWDVQTGECLQTIEEHTAHVMSVSYSSDGKYIVSASEDGTVRVWKLDKGEYRCIKTLENNLRKFRMASFSPDGKYLVAIAYFFSKSYIYVWDVNNDYECIKEIPIDIPNLDYSITSISFSPDSKYLLSALIDKTIRIWEVKNDFKCIKVLDKHTDIVYHSSFSPDGRYIVSASADKTICVWDVRNDYKCIKTLEGHLGIVYSAVFSYDGKYIVSTSADKTVRVWNVVDDYKCVNILNGHTHEVVSLAVGHNGMFFVSGSTDRTVHLWDLNKPKSEKIFNIHVNHSVAYNPKGTHIALTPKYFHKDSAIIILDINSGKTQHIKNAKYAKSVAYNSTGTLMVSAHFDNTICVWDVDDGYKHIKTLDKHTDIVNSAIFSPNGKYILSASADSTVRLWDVENDYKCIKVFDQHQEDVNSATFSSNGKYIVSTSNDGAVMCWNIYDYKRKWWIVNESNKMQKKGYTNVFYNPKTQYALMCVATDTQANIDIWKIGSDKLDCIIVNDAIESVFYSTDGKYAIVGGRSGSIYVWDVDCKVCIKTFEGHTDAVNNVSLSPDGESILSTSRDGTVRIWGFPQLQKLINKTKQRFKNVPLTEKERHDYFLE